MGISVIATHDLLAVSSFSKISTMMNPHDFPVFYRRWLNHRPVAGVLKKELCVTTPSNMKTSHANPRPSKWQSFQSDLQVFFAIISSFLNPGEMGIYCSSPSAIKRGNGKSPTSTEVCNWWWIFQQWS
jgi:hypothetical protein